MQSKETTSTPPLPALAPARGLAPSGRNNERRRPMRMKRHRHFLVLAFAGLGLAATCSDNPSGPQTAMPPRQPLRDELIA